MLVQDYCWIGCKGCGGEVGIPADLHDEAVECPQCKTVVRTAGRILYRPAAQHPGSPVPRKDSSLQDSATSEKVRQAEASAKLHNASENTLICGILSVVLGWTVLVPLIAVGFYGEVREQAGVSKEPIPSKATAGLLLALLFGITQTIVMLGSLK